jgi:hypothetical protein
VNPVWLFGPNQPGSISAGSVPGWYMGFLDGALRIMPGWEISVFGHPLTLAVLVPGVLVPGAFFTILAVYPLLDRRLTGEPTDGRLLDRPRDTAKRTAFGAAGITFYGLLWAAAANDQIAYHLGLSLYAVTWFFRVAVLAAPVLAYTVTERMCLGLARRDRDEAEHGRETGRIVMDPDGGYHEIREPVPALAGSRRGQLSRLPEPGGRLDPQRAAAAGDRERGTGGRIGGDPHRLRAAVAVGGHRVRAARHGQHHRAAVGADRHRIRSRGEGDHRGPSAGGDGGRGGRDVLGEQGPAAGVDAQRAGHPAQDQRPAAGADSQRPADQ